MITSKNVEQVLCYPVCPYCAISDCLLKKGAINGKKRFYCKTCLRTFTWNSQVVHSFCPRCFSFQLTLNKQKNTDFSDKRECLKCNKQFKKYNPMQINFLSMKVLHWSRWEFMSSINLCPQCFSNSSMKKGLSNGKVRLQCKICKHNFLEQPLPTSYQPVRLMIGKAFYENFFSARYLADMFYVSTTFITKCKQDYSEWIKCKDLLLTIDKFKRKVRKINEEKMSSYVVLELSKSLELLKNSCFQNVYLKKYINGITLDYVLPNNFFVIGFDTFIDH